MPKQNESPYVSHVFVCTNDRARERKSCADNNSQLNELSPQQAAGYHVGFTMLRR